MTAPLKEVKTNLASSTLNGGIDDSTTTVVLTSGASFPSTGNFRLLVESEIMIVTARSSNTLTVIRGQEGTSAASHADTTPAYHPITATSFLALGAQNWYQPWQYGMPYKLVDTDGSTELVASDFSWVNQGSATATDQNGTILLRCPPPGGTNLRILTRSHSAPNTYIAAFQQCCCPFDSNTEAFHFGLGFRQSSSGKFTVIMYISQAHNIVPEGSHMMQVRNWDDATGTGFTTIRSEFACCSIAPAIWLKVEDDNTNMKFYIGMDSQNWILIHTVSRTAFLTGAGPDQIMWYGQNSGSTNDALFRLVHFSRI